MPCYNVAMFDSRPKLCEHCFNDIVPGTNACVHCGEKLLRLQNWRIRRSLLGWLLFFVGVLIAYTAYEHLSLFTGWILVGGLWLARFGYRTHCRATAL